MKSAEEIQRAHDLLHAVIEFDHAQKDRMPQDLFIPMHAAHDAISWVLDGACKGPFEHNLKMLEEKMRDAGYRFVKRPPQPPPTFRHD